MTAVTLPASLPPLRDDLQLHEAAAHADGSPAWVIQDPVTNQFYRIGWLEFELLSRWHEGDPVRVIQTAARETVLCPSEDELSALYEFLLSNQLLDVHNPRYTDYLQARYRKARLGRAKWLLHHYLFFRWPLLYPARWLQQAMPAVAWLYSKTALHALLMLGALGLILTARQWDLFKAGFVDTLSTSGLLGYLVALAVTKSLHELGHALTATRYGLRVAHMGVAFVVMWPMLYTDTSESWRLKDRKQRLAIASAGIVTEMALAALATLAWNLAPDGSAVKQSLFYLASTAWLMSLTLNASPFMRFDGYFILSDALDMPNLHERAGALARASLRRTLLGWREPDPEPVAPARRRWLVAFALVTWVYRLGVFLGIAAAVYVFFFKLLGLFLFAVEIAWFVIRPVAVECRVWLERRGEIRRGRRIGAMLLLAALLAWLLIPWQRQVHADAWAHPTQTHVFYTPVPARLVVAAHNGQRLRQGEQAFEFDQPELHYKAAVTREASQALGQQLIGLSGESTGEERRASLEKRQAQLQAEREGQDQEAQRLQLRAPFDGILVDLDPELAPGVWASPRQALAYLVAPSEWEADVYVSQGDIERIQTGSSVRFYPASQPGSPIEGRVIDVDRARVNVLPHALMATPHGGPITVTPEPHSLTPKEALYRVRVKLSKAPQGLAVQRGKAILEGQAHSILADWLKPLVVVTLRELSF